MYTLPKCLKFLFVLSIGFLFIPHSAKASLNDSLKIHYTFESSNRDLIPDVSGNGHDGTMMGASIGLSNGKNSLILDKSGTNYLDMGSSVGNVVSKLNNFTIAVYIWVNSSYTMLSNYGNFIATFANSTNSGSKQNGYAIFQAKLTRYAISKTYYTSETDVQCGQDVEKGKWVHLIYMQSGDTGKVYVDGILKAFKTGVTLKPSALGATRFNFLARSCYQGDINLQDAQLSDFRLYNRAITDTEILNLNGYSQSLIDAYNQVNLTGDLTKVTNDLKLITQIDSSDVQINWTSSNSNVITDSGKVIQPALYDATVTLTATISQTIDGQTHTLKKDFFLTVLSATGKSHWESMILDTDTFKYLPATTEPDANWIKPEFNDSTWQAGKGGFGYADNDDSTKIAKCNSVYLRKKINIKDKSQIENLLLDMDYDDAFVFYVNGVECARSSNVTGAFPPYNATLTTDHEAKMYGGGSPERFQLKPSVLVNGENTFAIQVLNYNLSSSDLTSRVFVHTKIKSSGIIYHNTPAWFTEPVSFDISNLPLIFVNTNGQTIIQNSKITADMKVLDNPEGTNLLTDTAYQYNGKIGIEIRGFSSTWYPQKSYSVKTRTDSLTSNNVHLLGMPKENDWVFHAPYADKSMMRNVLAYNLGNQIGKWSPRTRFFEMYLNNNYQGVYVLVEKIKIDKNRLDLAKLTAADTTGDELTGGYVLKIDRPEATDIENVDYWFSPYRAWTGLQQKVPFVLHDPTGDKLNAAQRNYIRTYITDFEDAMYSDSYTDRQTGYYPFIDFTSFVEYYILTELSRNLDGYRVSTYLHKDKDSKGGKLTMGPYWDYNICYGNSNFFSAGNPQGWIIDGMGDADAYAMPFWWEKLRLDPYFNSYLKRNWNEMKDKFINTNYINNLMDSCAYVLRDAEKRHFQTWDILNTYVWPNNYIGGTYANEITYMKNWIRDRIDWMDTQIQPIVDITVDNMTPEVFPMDLITYPNPFTEIVNFKFYLEQSAAIHLQIQDILGRTIYNSEQNTQSGINQISIPADIFESNGVYLYQMMVDGKLKSKGKLVKN